MKTNYVENVVTHQQPLTGTNIVRNEVVKNSFTNVVNAPGNIVTKTVETTRRVI